MSWARRAIASWLNALLGWRHYRVTLVYLDKGLNCRFTQHFTVSVRFAADIDNHRMLKQHMGPVYTPAIRSALCNGRWAVTDINYLGRW